MRLPLCRRRFAWAHVVVWSILSIGPSVVRAADLPLIQIGVEVVEVDEQKTKKLGVNWMDLLHVEEKDVPSLLAFGTLTRSKVFADLQFLLERGGADMLANPKLVTRDGTTATFHAGGELPYAVSGSLGTTNVEFKPYGVNLKISPHLEASGHIALTLDAEVSGPDNQNAVTLSGNTVPGLRSRQVTSQITMEPHSTLTLAGLIQNQKQWKRHGVPGLMDIPVLGHLFSHKVEENQKTSVIVFVTPSLVDPADLTPGPKGPSAPKRPVSEGEASRHENPLDLLQDSGEIHG